MSGIEGVSCYLVKTLQMAYEMLNFPQGQWEDMHTSV